MVGRASARITLRADAAPDLIFIRKKENVKYSQKSLSKVEQSNTRKINVKAS